MFYSGVLYAKSRQVIISAAFRLRAKGGTLRRESPQRRNHKEDIRHGVFSARFMNRILQHAMTLPKYEMQAGISPSCRMSEDSVLSLFIKNLLSKIEFTILQRIRMLAHASNMICKTYSIASIFFLYTIFHFKMQNISV